MNTAAVNVGIFIIALLHVWFFVLEMFLWQKPIGLKIFKLNSDTARLTAPLAANQGLYNLFLSVGLLWSMVAAPALAWQLKIFFLGCVIIAGIYAGVKVDRRIFFIQGAPGMLVLAMLLVAM